MSQNNLKAEGEHMLTVCNACRYCEGYCAVWPAMEYRRTFEPGDLNYLANLCHNCGECYYACQYAPPHEFDVNPPLTFAKIRAQSYEQYAWPGPLAKAFRKNGLIISLISVFALIVFVYSAIAMSGGNILSRPITGGNFYQIIPHNVLAISFGAVSLYVLFALLIGLGRFWQDIGEKITDLANISALITASKEVLRLEYLDSNGWGCTYYGEQPSQSRRWFHHFTFYGFMLCLASTTVAAIYDYLFHWSAPYSYTSLPVVLGTLGGIGLLIGPAGLWLLKARRNRDISDLKQDGMDVSFVLLLMLISLTGLLLLVLRERALMGTLLVVHLAFVMSLFLTIPYGKFVHGIYRFAALLKYALERNRKQCVGH